MSQAEVHAFMKQHPNVKFTAKDIANSLTGNIPSIATSLRKLSTWNLIKATRFGKPYIYWYKPDPVNVVELCK